ncbi:hypothetical protein ACIOWK_35340 [Pseudomonas protegens]|uniref:hypothetical protein n=1 Tax=Pseudomonas protegens TaxID=380021 RepID=UPI0038094703
MKPVQFLLRGYAEHKDGVWQAFCIDLCLAAQGDSREEVIQKLHEQTYDYLKDIFEGEDYPYASQLLTRKAPLMQRIKYHYLACREQISHLRNVFTFQDAMPLKLA